jgi:DNA polymerase (family X)
VKKMQDPGHIAALLATLARLVALSGKDTFRARAYERGAELVRGLGPDLAELVEKGRLEEVEGIGASIRKLITEAWQTGRASALDSLCASLPPGAAELSRVPSLTLKRMRTLSEALGVHGVDSLREALDSGALATVSGFGPKLVERIAGELATLDRAELVTPELILSEAHKVAEAIAEHVARALPAASVEPTGALRRGTETLSVLELLAVAPDRAALLSAIADAPGVAHLDRERARGVLSRGLPLCVHVSSPEARVLRLWETTGPRAHLSRVAEQAPSPSGAASVFQDEAQLYAELGLAPVPPELRERPDALARAREGAYAELVEAVQVRGMVHCHTSYSDGKDSVLAMARAAHALGMEYITITDHSPTASYAGGVDLDRLKRQWDEIAAAQEEVPIRILRGTESDILADGSLDYPDSVLEQLDVVIASIHARYRMGEREMTERLVRAMSLPLFKVWGHALGRLLLSRPPFACDLPRVLDALAAAGGAVEISADPHRLDLAPEHIPLVRERGIPFVISVDAHSVAGLSVLPLGVTMARRGGVTRGEVLNTLSASEFAARVKPAGA